MFHSTDAEIVRASTQRLNFIAPHMWAEGKWPHGACSQVCPVFYLDLLQGQL